MKKAIRIAIPAVLILAIILCSGWYLLIYDREFTRDVFVQVARHFDDNGKHATAIWYYNLAYRQANDNDAVAIELAEQYKASGNYTKAEYTLSHAIADGGSIDLYIALCKTYVEQDKLLDAVNMLNNVSNAEIKAQLDALRPKTPICEPDPTTAGSYYVQYITVYLSSLQGKLYANNRGEVPSVQTDLYQNGIVLHDGENTIYAVTVAENGLVSPVAIFRFTVGGVVEKVQFTDSAVEAEIRNLLSVSAEKVLYTDDLWSIKDFTVPKDAEKLDDLRHMISLERLTVNNATAGQLSHIASLTNLSELNITATDISAEELTVISRLPGLKKLTLSNCNLFSVNELKDAANLVYLDLSSNHIRNIDSLSGMTKLQELYLQSNSLTDLQALSSLFALTHLNVSYNNITTMSAIASCNKLVWLDASVNSLTNASYCRPLVNLEYLNLAYNSIREITPIASCTALKRLNISNNALESISALSALNKLVTLDFSYNNVTVLPTWDTEAALVNIYGAYNKLTSLSPLKGLAHLNNVFMSYNAGISSVNELAICPVLIQVDVYGTKVKDASALTAQSIIVNYNPT